LANIPFGVFSTPETIQPRCATAIGDTVVDLSILAEAGVFDDIEDFSPRCFSNSTLNEFFAHGRPIWVAVRKRLIDLFSENGGSDTLRTNINLQSASLHDMKDVTMHLPARIGDYTDFYSSREHATNVGTMFRGKDNALQPNWLHLPVGYHGRSSTVFVSGTPVRRPYGQIQKDRDDAKQGSIFGPCRLLDFELEMAFFVGGAANAAGERLTATQAYDRIFGFCLMNDWSARDIQSWEYVPLGPFTAKNFATSISPWVVTTMALEDFTTPTSAKEQVEPIPLEYLQDPNYSSFDVALEVGIQSQDMDKPETVTQSNFANLYWNATQQLVHHAVTGCIMQPGDLLGSGTISGSVEKSYGSMLELCWKGTKEVTLGSSGEVRKFLHDGDTVVMKGWCQKAGHGRVGFGACSGTILPALTGSGEIQKMPMAVKSRYQDIKLYSYWKSSSAYRVRIALAAKRIAFETITLSLTTEDQYGAEHISRNPMCQVPVLECTDTATKQTIQISQSIAIIEFLEEAFPARPSLFPTDTTARATARQMVEIINSGIQPLQNQSMLRDIEGRSEGKISAIQLGNEGITKGLKALEALVTKQLVTQHNKKFCMGGFVPTIVDACLVPQLYNAHKFGVDLAEVCPTLEQIGANLESHPWFVAAHPDAQPDAGT
jgi:fumarylacetoacetase